MTERRAIATVFYDMDKEITVLEDRLDKNRAIKQGAGQFGEKAFRYGGRVGSGPLHCTVAIS